MDDMERFNRWVERKTKRLMRDFESVNLDTTPYTRADFERAHADLEERDRTAPKPETN